MLKLNFKKESSNIKGARYDEDSYTLEVTFKRNLKYLYLGVQPELITEWLESVNTHGESVGEFFNDNIKDAHSVERL